MANNITVAVSQVGASTSEARTRQHSVIIDRPEAKGGADRGPMGGELFLAGVGGCFMSNLLAAVRARDAALSEARVEVVGTLAEAPARFEAIHLRVSAKCDDQDLFRKLVDIADRGCIMTNTLRATTSLTVDIA